jgi:hypothetical protein
MHPFTAILIVAFFILLFSIFRKKDNTSGARRSGLKIIRKLLAISFLSSGV